MRTTFNIEDSVYSQIKHIAESKKLSLGDVISSYLKIALSQESLKIKFSDNFPIIPTISKNGKITDDFINKIREEELV